jgi:hypothetical protein
LNSWDIGYCFFNSIIAFTGLYLFQIIPFALGAASVKA